MQYLPHVTITRELLPRYMPSSASRVSMDHQQKAPECAYTFVFFAVLRTCMQNRKQAGTVKKKGACTMKQALSSRNKGESRLAFDEQENHCSAFFSRPLFLISSRCPPLRLSNLCTVFVSSAVLGDWFGTPLSYNFCTCLASHRGTAHQRRPGGGELGIKTIYPVFGSHLSTEEQSKKKKKEEIRGCINR